MDSLPQTITVPPHLLSPRSKPAFASEEGRGLQRWDRFATYTEASLGVRSSPYSLAAITHGQNRSSLVVLIIYHDCLLSARKGIKLNSLAPDVDAMSQSLENRSVSAVQEYFPFYFCRPLLLTCSDCRAACCCKSANR